MKANTFRETRTLFAGRRGINALFSGIKGAQTPLRGLNFGRGYYEEQFCEIILIWTSGSGRDERRVIRKFAEKWY